MSAFGSAKQGNFFQCQLLLNLARSAKRVILLPKTTFYMLPGPEFQTLLDLTFFKNRSLCAQRDSMARIPLQSRPRSLVPWGPTLWLCELTLSFLVWKLSRSTMLSVRSVFFSQYKKKLLVKIQV